MSKNEPNQLLQKPNRTLLIKSSSCTNFDMRKKAFMYRVLKIMFFIVFNFILTLYDFSRAGVLIDTYAGGCICDGMDAIESSLNIPLRMTISSDGDIYFSDSENHRIRKIDQDGIISTVAGTGEASYCGDYNPAIEACLKHPTGVAFSPSGELHFIDSDNSMIRKITAKGIIEPVAGTGEMGFGGDGGDALLAQLSRPRGIIFDEVGNIFIADTFNHRIRRVDTSGNIETIGGNGVEGYSGDRGLALDASFNQPRDLAIDSSGIYVADTHNHCIRKIFFSTGIVKTIAGTGEAAFGGDNSIALDASFNQPRGIHLSSEGVLFIADTLNHRIRKLGQDNIITTIVGNGKTFYGGDGEVATEASISWPYDIFLDEINDKLYVVDTNNQRLRVVDSNKIISSVAGTGTGCFSGDDCAATEGGLAHPSQICVNNITNEIYIADSQNHRVRKVDSTGIMTTVAGNGTDGYDGDGKLACQSSLSTPIGVAVKDSNELYIADTGNNRIRKIDASGVISTIAGNGSGNYYGDGGLAIDACLNGPKGIAIWPDNGILIADTKNNRIRFIDNDTKIISTIAGDGTAGFGGDGGLAIYANVNSPRFAIATPEEYIYISDTGNNRIRVIDPLGIIYTLAGTGVTIDSIGLPISEEEIGSLIPAIEASLNNPGQLVYLDNKLYYIDTNYQRVRFINLSTGLIETYAGTGRPGFKGDGQPAFRANLNFPQGLAIMDFNFYIGDTVNNRIRILYPF